MKRRTGLTLLTGLTVALVALCLAGCSWIAPDPETSGRGFIERTDGREIYVGAPGSWWECQVDAVSGTDLPAGTKLTREACPEARVRVTTPLPETLYAAE